MTWLELERLRNPNPPAPTLPPRFAGAVLKDVQPGAVRDVLCDYSTQFWQVAADGRGPLFLGRAASGKTTAAAVLARLVAPHVETCWVSVPVLQVGFERSRFDPTLTQQIEHWHSVPFLVLDDFAVIEPRSPGHGILTAVIASRFDHQRPTCYTGNLSLPAGREWEALAERYGPLVARRLRDTSTGFVALTLK